MDSRGRPGRSADMAFVHQAPAQTQQELMKVCADEWNNLKAANQTAGQDLSGFHKGMPGEAQSRHQARWQFIAGSRTDR